MFQNQNKKDDVNKSLRFCFCLKRRRLFCFKPRVKKQNVKNKRTWRNNRRARFVCWWIFILWAEQNKNKTRSFFPSVFRHECDRPQIPENRWRATLLEKLPGSFSNEDEEMLFLTFFIIVFCFFLRYYFREFSSLLLDTRFL